MAKTVETTTGAESDKTADRSRIEMVGDKEIEAAAVDQTESRIDAAPANTTIPELPNVPTKEPALPGEPEVKKLKLSQ